MSLKPKDKGKLMSGDLKSDPRERVLKGRELYLEGPDKEEEGCDNTQVIGW